MTGPGHIIVAVLLDSFVTARAEKDIEKKVDECFLKHMFLVRVSCSKANKGTLIKRYVIGCDACFVISCDFVIKSQLTVYLCQGMHNATSCPAPSLN